ncbi:glutamate 5-kinase [Basidiobolus meristosporus CBS 931.73]|uniref:Glutamate 5-kinase n=1 Tax=Basidiobolus meristosporus CBS 931.73 TaxID=1314790 RepID=A0A1Y1YZJ9_9FUNG|nr:glutamate 5-kinase [Basidiobolus meristosporus CBS 931.73]|eukprot:ORY03366.1 glutamate 5-kinase [Basidiobolus meristosporus CBS 931.73]
MVMNTESRKSLTIVLKLGTSSICDEVTHLPHLANLSHIVETIVKLKSLGHRVVLTTSGAVGIGMRALNVDVKPPELAKKQALAAVGQSKLMSLYEDLFSMFKQPTAQILITKGDLADRTRYNNARDTFEELFKAGVVPIVNENDTISVNEIRFGDNDTLSAITAGMVHADYLFLLTDVDCLYTDNPRTNPDAKVVSKVTDIEQLKKEVNVATPGSSVGTGGMVTKLIAAELATSAGVHTVITRGSEPERVFDIIEHYEGGDNGKKASVPLHTCFIAKSVPMVDRKWWILHGIHTAGTVVVDEESANKLATDPSALSSSHILRVDGQFVPNQGVSIAVEKPINKNGEVGTVMVGKGLVNYSSKELDRIKGCKEAMVSKLLGYNVSPLVVERENYVTLV